MKPSSGNKARQGLSLVETALIISIAGVLFAVALPTFVRTVETSKTSEATTTLASLYHASASYYGAPRKVQEQAPTPPAAEGARAAASTAAAEQAPEQAPTPREAFCLPDAAGPTPDKPSQKPVTVDFSAEGVPGAATWRALGFAPAAPLRYRYSFLPTPAGCRVQEPAARVAFRLLAEGDLDGDGSLSRFERSARIVKPGELAADPVLHVRDRVE